MTGAAGFIGSNLSENLIDSGNHVIGVDCFTDYYPKEQKLANLKNLLSHGSFTFLEEDIVSLNLDKLLEGIDYVFHEAAQPGVRSSWGSSFEVYTRNNISATQRLLEASRKVKLKKFVYASSSSVYGDCPLPMREDRLTRPVSPYGVSKLAAEHLCYLYWKNYAIPTVSLRYFTVFGPRQRPDMAFNRFIRAILKGDEITVFGNGSQTRDFTYVSDIVQANVLAMKPGVEGEVFNIGGGSRISLKKAIRIMEETLDKKANLRFVEKQQGDVVDTLADVSKANEVLKYAAAVGVEEGIRKECEWLVDSMK